LRGIAILMMVWFHFLWDLNFFGFTQIILYEGFWGVFQKATAGTFLFLVGTSLTINYNRNKENFEKRFLLRSIKIFFWALLITIFSLIFFPSQIILFGILHLIGLSILFSIFFVKRKYLNLALSLLVFFAVMFFDFTLLNIEFLFWAGLAKSAPALDFFPLIPWISVVFLGLFFGNFFYEGAKAKINFKNPQNKAVDFIGFLGKNALFIYFIHQPILFSLVGIARFLI